MTLACRPLLLTTCVLRGRHTLHLVTQPMTTEQLYLAELPVMPEAEVAEPVAETVPEPKSAIDLELKEKVDG